MPDMPKSPPKPEDVDSAPDELFERIGMDRETYRQRQKQRLDRAAQSPGPGDAAPDFRLEKLTEEGDRTGEYVTLSELRGRPVALAFGSYT